MLVVWIFFKFFFHGKRTQDVTNFEIRVYSGGHDIVHDRARKRTLNTITGNRGRCDEINVISRNALAIDFTPS